MSMATVPGSWRGFVLQASGPTMQLFDDDTEPPSQPMDTDEEIPIPNAAQEHVPLMTLEELLVAPGRNHLQNLHPARENGGGWFGYTLGITKSVKNIMENNFPHATPNWTSIDGETKVAWFTAFAQKYNWDSCHTTLVREKFEALCTSRLLDRVYEWKQLWLKDEKKPSWMKDTVWAGFIIYWTVAKNVKRSKTNSENRNSQRGGYGISKHTCGSYPYIRMRENMRDEETGELPDMVTFMEMTHKRKKDGVFVDKKAEAIARKCRALEVDFRQTQLLVEGSLGDSELPHAEMNAIYRSEVKVKNGRRFGCGEIDVHDPAPTLGNDSPDYKQMYLDTQKELLQATTSIGELTSQVEDAVYWSKVMRNLYPALVPPSQATTTGPTTTTVNYNSG